MRSAESAHRNPHPPALAALSSICCVLCSCNHTEQQSESREQQRIVYEEVSVFEPVCVLVWLESVAGGGGAAHGCDWRERKARRRERRVLNEARCCECGGVCVCGAERRGKSERSEVSIAPSAAGAAAAAALGVSPLHPRPLCSSVSRRALVPAWRLSSVQSTSQPRCGCGSSRTETHRRSGDAGECGGDSAMSSGPTLCCGWTTQRERRGTHDDESRGRRAVKDLTRKHVSTESQNYPAVDAD